MTLAKSLLPLFERLDDVDGSMAAIQAIVQDEYPKLLQARGYLPPPLPSLSVTCTWKVRGVSMERPRPSIACRHAPPRCAVPSWGLPRGMRRRTPSFGQASPPSWQRAESTTRSSGDRSCGLPLGQPARP